MSAFAAPASSPPARRRWLLALEPLLLAAAAPLLLFPRGALPMLGLALLAAAWPARRLATGHWGLRQPLSRWTPALALMAVVGLGASSDLALSLPKFYGILLGLGIAYAACALAAGRRLFWLGIAALCLAIPAIAGLGLVSVEWAGDKVPGLKQLYPYIPRLIREVQASGGMVKSVNPNELGGTLAWLLPLPLALLLRPPRGWFWRPALLLVVVAGGAVLALAASRSAYVALAAAALALACWRWRRLGLALAVGTLVALLGAALLMPEQMLAFWLAVDALGPANESGPLAERVEIWQQARYMIEDFPFTGIGLNTFDVVLDTLYPLFGVGRDASLVHAHNIFLQTALDLGLGGLCAFLGLCVSACVAGGRAYRRLDTGPRQAAIMGLLAGLLAYLVFGLTDAIALGAKPTVLLWLLLGLLYSGGQGDREASSTARAPWLHSLADVYWFLTYLLVLAAVVVVALGLGGG